MGGERRGFLGQTAMVVLLRWLLLLLWWRWWRRLLDARWFVLVTAAIHRLDPFVLAEEKLDVAQRKARGIRRYSRTGCRRNAIQQGNRNRQVGEDGESR